MIVMYQQRLQYLSRSRWPNAKAEKTLSVECRGTWLLMFMFLVDVRYTHDSRTVVHSNTNSRMYQEPSAVPVAVCAARGAGGAVQLVSAVRPAGPGARNLCLGVCVLAR